MRACMRVATRVAPRLAVIAAVAFALACYDPMGTAPGPTDELGTQDGLGGPASELDKQLRALLIESSAGAGLRYFTLPLSNQLNKIPQDPNNPLTPQKVKLGQLLYHETALAVDNVRAEGFETYSCASCHFAQAGFQAGLPQGIAEGGSGFGIAGEGRVLLAQYDSDPDMPDVQPIRTPSILNTAYQELMLWNGQFGGVGDNLGTEHRWTPGTPLESNFLGLHGLETQAHAGMGVHRMSSVESSLVATLPEYNRRFRAAFPGEPNPINRLNAALAIAAFERTVLANKSPWQQWLRGKTNAMTDAEKQGAIIFFGKANCDACHTGPSLNSMTFHALGMNDIDGSHDLSRVDLRPTGGTVPDGTRRGRGGFTGVAEDNFKWKTAQLYNLLDSPFYGHGGSFATVREVVEYKNAAIPENAMVPIGQLAPQFQPLGLSSGEIDALVAFLGGALYDPDLMRYVPDALPSGYCTPVNDPQARIDLGCSLLAGG